MKKRLLIIILIVLIIVTLFITVIVKRHNNKITIGVSIIPEETFIKEIAKDKVDIVTLIPSGYSLANYEPSAKDIEKFSKVNLYLSIGIPLEDNIIPKLKKISKNMNIINLVDIVKENHELIYLKQDSIDPYIWMSPIRVISMVDEIAEQLGNIDKKNKDYYIKNANEYKKRLEGVNNRFKKELGKKGNKYFIMYHPSLAYFADDYGLEMIVIQAQCDGLKLQKVINEARFKNIKAVLYQSETDSSQVQVLAREIGGITYKINPLSKDYIKNLLSILDYFKEINYS
ncbi:metal ABC transporter solute-binding protein, Zn/Mn family [Abyssisolibacter fermentans]|uniref:metal ABC transporter solute-binding protein, Zn/Mn family n=1 Tax=Abyssisolibacter fermentans TaxID=1766203 RepID=UPI000833DC14|nr:zinc ABC transporter substrate-binding protein [Abyssisolibacter fermentans]